jgi:hypothetical protein
MRSGRLKTFDAVAFDTRAAVATSERVTVAFFAAI